MCAWLFISWCSELQLWSQCNDDGQEDHDEDDDGQREPSSLKLLIFFKSPLPCPPPLLIHWWADRNPKKIPSHPPLGNRDLLIHPVETGRSLKIWPYQVLVLILNYLELATPFIQSTKESLARSIHKTFPSPFLPTFALIYSAEGPNWHILVTSAVSSALVLHIHGWILSRLSTLLYPLTIHKGQLIITL